MPWDNDTGAYIRRPTTVLDETPDGDTVNTAVAQKLDTVGDDATADLNHHRVQGGHYPTPSAAAASRYLKQSPAGAVSWNEGVPIADAALKDLSNVTAGVTANINISGNAATATSAASATAAASCTGNSATATDLASGSVLAVAKGGTGASTAADALENLGLLSAVRDVQAGTIRLWPSLTVPVLADGLPLGLPLDGAVVSLATYPRLSRALCPSGNNGWAPGWYRCTAGGTRDVAGTYIKLDDWRGGYPQVLDAGAGRSKSTVLVNTATGSAAVTIVNNLSAGGTLVTPYTGSDGIDPGLAVSGTGIPAGATVVSVAGATVTLSAACTYTGGSVEATITGRVLGSWQPDAMRKITGRAGAVAGGSIEGALAIGYLAAGGTFNAAGDKYAITIDTSRQHPTAPTGRPAGPVANAIILV